jgi:hypothetical protein
MFVIDNNLFKIFLPMFENPKPQFGLQDISKNILLGKNELYYFETRSDVVVGVL